jgi:hypothetical protein
MAKHGFQGQCDMRVIESFRKGEYEYRSTNATLIAAAARGQATIRIQKCESRIRCLRCARYNRLKMR